MKPFYFSRLFSSICNIIVKTFKFPIFTQHTSSKQNRRIIVRNTNRLNEDKSDIDGHEEEAYSHVQEHGTGSGAEVLGLQTFAIDCLKCRLQVVPSHE